MDGTTFTTWPSDGIRAVSGRDTKRIQRVIGAVIAFDAFERSERYAVHFFTRFVAGFDAVGVAGFVSGGFGAGTSVDCTARAVMRAAVFPGLERGCAELTNESDLRTFTMQTREADGRSALNRSSGFPSIVRFQRNPRRPR